MGGCQVDEFRPLRLWWDGQLTQERIRDGILYSLEQYWPPETDWIQIIQITLHKYHLSSYHDLQEGVSEIVRILWSRDIFERFDPTRSSSFLIYFRGIVDNALNNMRVSRNRVDRETDYSVERETQDGEGSSLISQMAQSQELSPSSEVSLWEGLRKELSEIHSRITRRFSANLRIHCADVFASFEQYGIPNSKAGFLDACQRNGVPGVSGRLLWPHYRRECRKLVRQYFAPKKRGGAKRGNLEMIWLEVLGRQGQYFVLSRGLHTSRVVRIDCYESYLTLAGSGGRKGAMDPSLRVLNDEVTRGVITEIVDFNRKFR